MGNKRGMLNKDEQPAREVEVKPFAIGVYEVTFAQYDAFARATGRRLPEDFGWGRDERPVVDVTWDDALAYTQWLSQQTGKSYRLPTEAEWEYAARGGTDSRYWWGINTDKGKAVCFDCGTQWDGRSTAPAGSLAPNPFGLYDTSGNAMEWVEDCYNENYKGAPADGSAWLSGDCSKRMVRGGAFNKPSSSLRSSARYQLPQESQFNMLGFRVVRE
jgi:formylglycine-generating enzyme required for sulfatase activity